MSDSRLRLFFILAIVFTFTAACSVDVPVTGGVVRGLKQWDGSTVFLGIPYAAPPMNELRWRAPAPVKPWLGVRTATRAPAPCLQHDEGWNTSDAINSREDCLYLSIHMPKQAASTRWPVLVWIHGGSNVAGSGFGFVNSTVHRQGIVLVSIEYRLGVFGFLASPALNAESATHTSGNYALLDQVAALRWVRDNIASFGGDPNNVTIAGQSAGAYDITLLLTSPLARGLFHKAISQSAVRVSKASLRSREQSESLGEQFAALMSVPSPSARLEVLRATSGKALLEAADKFKADEGAALPVWGQAAIDGYVLPRSPSEIYAAGEQAPVPLLIGNNSREVIFESADYVRKFIAGKFGDRAPELLAAYGLSGASDPDPDPMFGNVQTQLPSDLYFGCAANRVAELHFQAGQPVWRYQFGLGPPGTGRPAEHSSELKYVFDAPRSEKNFARWPPLQIYWANFARTGNPNETGLPHWPAFGTEANYIDFTPQGERVGNDLRGTICRLLYDDSRRSDAN